MTPLSIAFLPLTDSAPLIVAKERGFAEAQGIDLQLVKTTSWATLRDRLVYGQVQAAHMLAPLAIAVTLGLSQHPAALCAPFKLNANGNALVMASDFAAALDPDPAKRGRPNLGVPILIGMAPTEPNRWEGHIYNTENGKTYSGSIRVEGDKLKLQGCLFTNFLCGGQDWTHVTALPTEGVSLPMKSAPVKASPKGSKKGAPTAATSEVCTRVAADQASRATSE